jgi:hypothetical protein
MAKTKVKEATINPNGRVMRTEIIVVGNIDFTLIMMEGMVVPGGKDLNPVAFVQGPGTFAGFSFPECKAMRPGKRGKEVEQSISAYEATRDRAVDYINKIGRSINEPGKPTETDEA